MKHNFHSFLGFSVHKYRDEIQLVQINVPSVAPQRKLYSRLVPKLLDMRLIFTSDSFWKPGVLTIYKNHPVGNFRHKR